MLDLKVASIIGIWAEVWKKKNPQNGSQIFWVGPVLVDR